MRGRSFALALLTFVRESIKEHPNKTGRYTDLHAIMADWYGSTDKIPWAQMVLTWLRKRQQPQASDEAKLRFTDAFWSMPSGNW